MDYSQGSSVHGIAQARILEWIAFPSPGDLPKPGPNPCLLLWQADSLRLSRQGSPCGLRISLSLSSPTLLCLALEFFPVQSQESTLGGHPRDLLENWGVTILSSPTFFPAQN